jgi:putative phage-type endonuclease
MNTTIDTLIKSEELNCYDKQLKELLDEENELEKNRFFTQAECDDIIDSIGIILNDIIKTDPMIFADPKFNENIFNYVEGILKEQLKLSLTIKKETPFGVTYASIFDTTQDDKLNEELKDNAYLEFIDIIKYAFSLYYYYIVPKRSSGDTYIRIKPNIPVNRAKINYLKSIKQPEQRTDEWYIFRQHFLTASSIWKALGTECSKNQLIYDKCKPLDVNKYKIVSTETPMHWGNKYEPISIQLYELIYETKISDFGCIPHKTISYIAASPDGINTLETSDRYGRMLEVKNIVNRDITGIPKKEYWIQMQIQMEVCNLNECDFLETRFKEYETYQDFIDDVDEDNPHFLKTKQDKHKGIIMYFIKDQQPFYEYSPLNMTENECSEWEQTMMYNNDHLTWVKNIYWKLDELSCILVLRNKLWFNSVLPQFDYIWNVIEHEKINGYEHRAPTKRVKKILCDNSEEEISTPKCLIKNISYFTQDLLY